MRKISLVLLSALAMAAGTAKAGMIYAENFEDGVFDGAEQGYNIPGGLGGGSSLFHITGNDPKSGNFALGFVYGETPGSTPNGSYAFAPTGTIYTPEINLPSVGSVKLSFDVANFGRGNTFYDRFDIGVFTKFGGTDPSDPGRQHFVKASTFPGYAGIGATIYPENNGYNTMTSFLDDFRGQTVRIYIHYSIIGVTGGNYAGGRFDNLSITDATAAVPEPGMIGLLGLGLAGLAARRRKRG